MNTQPKQIVVPPEGIALTVLLGEIGLTFDQVNPLLGYELGAPRDYSMPAGARCLVFTKAGVLRLASLFGLAVDVPVAAGEVVDMQAAAGVVAPEIEVKEDAHGRPRGPWWKQGDLE
ncbi:MAG: hypothetical protein WC205_04110 [Opitutaceae bacterium]|jgi:hypothetical protein